MIPDRTRCLIIESDQRMDSRAAIQLSMDMGRFIVETYIADMTDAELLVRPVPGINHTAWQLGHVIASENYMISAVAPGLMPALPAGFAEKHAKATSSNDNPADFCTKAEYQRVLAEQHQGALAALATQTDEMLDQPAPEEFQSYCKSVGDLFSLYGSHFTMHAGQWAVTRRVLGRPPLF